MSEGDEVDRSMFVLFLVSQTNSQKLTPHITSGLSLSHCEHLKDKLVLEYWASVSPLEAETPNYHNTHKQLDIVTLFHIFSLILTHIYYCLYFDFNAVFFEALEHKHVASGFM